MKQVSDKLKNHLHSGREFYICDLYEIILFSGLKFRYANYKLPIMLPDGSFFTHRGPNFTRSKIKITSSITVDKLDVTMEVDDHDKIGDTPTLQVAHNGGFDEATLSLYRCFMDKPGSVIEAVEWFTGDIDVKDGGGLEIALEVKSAVQRLNIEWPKGKYYPTCSFTLYSPGCGLNKADFEVIGTVTSVINQVEFNTNLTQADGYYDQGGIEWLDGPLAGSAAPVKNYYQTNGKIIMLIPLNAAPVVGNTFRIYPGCERNVQTCKEKFNHFLRNRATPYIPLKETIM